MYTMTSWFSYYFFTKTSPSYDTLVFSDGGINSMAYIGALAEIESRKLSFGKYVGTGMGALYASMCALQYDANEMEQVMSNVDLSKMFRYSIFGEQSNLIERWGSCDNDWLYTLAGDIITNKTNNRNYTIHDLYNDTGIELLITALNVNKRTIVHFHPKHTNKAYRDIPIRTAIRLSSNTPFIYEKQSYDGDYWVQGCINTEFIRGEKSCLCLNVVGSKGHYAFSSSSQPPPIDSLVSYSKALIESIIIEHERASIDPLFKTNTIIITTNVASSAVASSAANDTNERNHQNLIVQGRQAACAFFGD